MSRRKEQRVQSRGVAETEDRGQDRDRAEQSRRELQASYTRVRQKVVAAWAFAVVNGTVCMYNRGCLVSRKRGNQAGS